MLNAFIAIGGFLIFLGLVSLFVRHHLIIRAYQEADEMLARDSGLEAYMYLRNHYSTRTADRWWHSRNARMQARTTTAKTA